MTVRYLDDTSTDLRWLVVESGRGMPRAWCGTETEAIDVAKEIAADPDTRGVVFVLELKAVVS